MKPARLITITRGDLNAGLQLAQTAHAVAEFCLEYPVIASEWRDDGNFIICLQVKDWSKLWNIRSKLSDLDIPYNLFYEPDIEEETAIAFVETEETKSITKKLPLAGR